MCRSLQVREPEKTEVMRQRVAFAVADGFHPNPSLLPRSTSMRVSQFRLKLLGLAPDSCTEIRDDRPTDHDHIRHRASDNQIKLRDYNQQDCRESQTFPALSAQCSGRR